MDEKREKLLRRMAELEVLENEILERERRLLEKEKEQKRKEKEKKQVLLRLSPILWEKLVQLSERDFRSINGEIEFLLHESVEKHLKHSNLNK